MIGLARLVAALLRCHPFPLHGCISYSLDIAFTFQSCSWHLFADFQGFLSFDLVDLRTIGKVNPVHAPPITILLSRRQADDLLQSCHFWVNQAL